MTILSKLFRKSCRDWTCYELGHTWTPYCRNAWFETGFHSFKEGFKIYLPLYLVTAFLRGKGPEYYLKQMMPEVLRSSTFLGVNGFIFLFAFCAWRWLFGEPVFAMMFLAALVGGCSAILLERRPRRQLLAVYMANIAVETLYLMLKGRGLVRPLPYGEVWLFSGVVATLMYLLRKDRLHGSTLSAVEFLAVGKRHRDSADDKTSSPAPTPTRPWRFLHAFGIFSRLRTFVLALRQSSRHRLCQHANSCLSSSLEGGARLFSIGYLLQTVLRSVRSVGLLPRKPLLFLRRSLLHQAGLRFGGFVGSLVLLLRGLRCLLCRLRNADSTWHAPVVGFLAGWSMCFFRSSTLAMYAASKTVEILVLHAVERGFLPSVPGSEILLYSLSVAFVFHACILEPHNVRPAYYAFLRRLCDNRFQMMNRRLLDEFGTQASKLDPDFWPDYDPKFTLLAQGPHMLAELAKQRRLGLS